jgi:hypothetical protein
MYGMGAVYAHSLRSAKAYTVGYSALMECKTARARCKTVYLARLAMDPWTLAQALALDFKQH